jgi:hypothetical protein
MSEWGRAVYGDPCRECGYDWSISQENAMALIATIPARYAALLRGRDGAQRHPDLGWPAKGYVCHVGDNLRIWSERLAGAALSSIGHIPPYDQDLLARARAYEEVSMEGALWSLERAVGDWLSAVEMALQSNVVLTHPERGEQTLLDVCRTNAHDAHHHEWDIRRSIE